MIAIYISVFCLETIAQFRVPKPLNITGYNPLEDLTLTPLKFRSLTRPHAFLVTLDYICIAFFTLELLIHIAVCPNPKELFRSLLTWIDIFTIIPLYFVIIFENFASAESVYVELIKSVKVLRILLIFKIANHFTGVRVLWYTFRASATELLMLIFFLGIGVLFSGVFIYYAETMFGTRNSEFSSIPIGFWWGLVTMTTLGYGDFCPKTFPGYLVGASCAIVGVLVIALPIPVIVNNFTVYYAHAQALSSMPARPRVILAATTARRLQTTTGQSVNVEESSLGPGSARASVNPLVQVDHANKPAHRRFLSKLSSSVSNLVSSTTSSQQSSQQLMVPARNRHRSLNKAISTGFMQGSKPLLRQQHLEIPSDETNDETSPSFYRRDSGSGRRRLYYSTSGKPTLGSTVFKRSFRSTSNSPRRASMADNRNFERRMTFVAITDHEEPQSDNDDL